MAKFRLFWENNSETPLSSNRLSSFTNYYSEDTLLYIDDPSIIPNGDGHLKLRSLSKVGLVGSETLAAFNFERSFVSFDSKFSPSEQDGVVFRDEYYTNKGSLSFDIPIQNIISNPGFEDGGVDWVFENSGIDSSIQYTTDDYYPYLNSNNLKSAKISTGEIYGLSKLSKNIDTSSINDSISLSFYYKSTDDFYFMIKTGSIDNIIYWNDITWVGTENRYTLSESNKWKRIEIPQIYTNNIDFVDIEFFITSTDNEFYLDSFLVENKPYCSSFYFEDTNNSILKYNRDVINYDQGIIDFVFFPKFSADQVFFTLKSTTETNDAIRVEYDSNNNEIIISLYDLFSMDYISFRHPFPLVSIVDSWSRFVLNWDLNKKKVMLYADSLPLENEDFSVPESKIYSFNIGENFEKFRADSISGFFIGSNVGNKPFRGLIDFFKINSKYKDESDFLIYLNQYPKIDSPEFKLFENPNKSLVVDESILDVGSFTPSSQYFVWICDNDDGDSAEVLISKNSKSPNGYGWFNSKKIGGFHTDENNNIDLTSLWDITAREKSLISDRLVVGNTRLQRIEDTTDNTKLTPVEIRTKPGDPNNHALFNIDSTFTQSVFGRNRTDGNFFHLDNLNGELFLDNIHINSNTLNSIGSDLEIFAESPNTLHLHSHEVVLQSEGTDVKIDDLRVFNNTLYPKDGSDLVINTKLDGNNNLNIETDIFTTNSLYSVTNTANNFTVNTGTDFIVSSDDKIYLDDIVVDDKTISSDDILHLFANSGPVQVELLNFNYNKLFYGNETKRYIRFYEDLNDSELENIDIVSDNLVKIDSPRFEVTAGQIVFHADMTNYFKLEDVRIDGNKIFTESGTNLLLGGQDTETSENVSIRSNDNINLNTTNFSINTNATSFTTTSFLINNVKVTSSTIESVNGETLHLGTGTNPIRFDSTVGAFENLGLGTMTPAGDVHIYNDSGSHLILDSFDNNNSNIDLITKSNGGDKGLGSSDTKGWQISGRGDQWTQASERNSIQLNYWNGSSWVSPFIFNSSGMFGVGNNNPQYPLDVNGDVRIQTDGSKLRFTNTSSSVQEYALYNSNGDFTIESSGGHIHLNNNTKISKELSVGPETSGQSNFQSLSSQTDQGFTQTPWLYVSGGVEADGRDASGTGMFFHDGNFNSDDNHISFVTNGSSRMQIQDDGHIRIGNSGTLYPGNQTPANNGFLTYHGDFKAYRVYNAVWMDLAECWYKDEKYEFEYGMVVVQTENGIRPAMKRAEKATVGVVSNTYGYILNSKDFDADNFENSKAIPVAISGRVNTSYVGKLSIGDEVVANKNGGAIKANFIEKIIKRDRIVGRVDSVSGSTCSIKVY